MFNFIISFRVGLSANVDFKLMWSFFNLCSTSSRRNVSIVKLRILFSSLEENGCNAESVEAPLHFRFMPKSRQRCRRHLGHFFISEKSRLQCFLHFNSYTITKFINFDIQLIYITKNLH